MKLIRSGAYIPLALLLIFSLCSSCQQKSSEEKIQPVADQNPPALRAETDTAAQIANATRLYEIGDTYLVANKRDSALYYHKQALAIRERVGKNDRDMFNSFVKVGEGYSDKVKYNVADNYFERAYSLIGGNVKLSPLDEVGLLVRLSFIKTNLKDIPTSISLLHRARKIITNCNLEDNLVSGRIYYSLGNAYSVDNQHELAIINFKKAAFWFSKLQDKNGRMASSFLSLGIVYHAIKQDHRALDSYAHAINHYLRLYEPESVELAKVYLQKATAHQALGELDSAEYYFRWNLRIRTNTYGEKDVNTFGAKLALGHFYKSVGNYDSAAKYSHECLISLVKNFNDHNLKSNPFPGNTELNTDLVIGLVNKASTLKVMTERDSNRGNLDLSLNTYLLADSVFTIFRRNLKYDDPQLKELEVGYIPYDQMVELTFNLFKQTGNKDYLNKAIKVMEQSRSVLLESTLNKAKEYDTIHGSRRFRDKVNNMVGQRSEILRQLSLADLPQSTSDSLGEALLSLNDSFSELQKTTGPISASYLNGLDNQKVVGTQEMQSLLKKRNSILFEFLWSNEKIFELVISSDKIETKVVVQTDSFKQAFENFVILLQAPPSEAIKQENFDRFSKGAFVLYRDLIGDFLPKNPKSTEGVNLIFSANGPLATIPFEALITQLPGGNDVNYRLPYLVQRFPISYAYSSSILVKQSKPARIGNKLLALGFAGNGDSGVERNGLNSLPGTEREIRSIMAVMKNNTNKYYLENEASEAAFKSQVADFDIVHLAIHGLADSTNALNSKLVFRSEFDTTEDSNLYAHELYNLNLDKLDLAVLSACESGIGKVQEGEGVMSIARGFAAAGCPSLVISLWKINDGTSAQVMGDFYKHLSYGEDINKALANAKKDYMANASEFNSHPAYWAAFMQVGDTRAIDIKVPETKYLLIASIVLIAAAAFVITGYRRHQRTVNKKAAS